MASKLTYSPSQPKSILRKCALVGFMALAFSSGAISAPVELITNGSFETTTSGSSDRMTSNVDGWNVVDGYTFLAYPGTATTTGYGYGLTMWDATNGGGPYTVPYSSPDGGKFVVSDGGYLNSTIYQTVTGLQVGATYQLSFYQAAGQQKPYYTATTEQWIVSFGGTLGSGNIVLPNGNTVSGAGIIIDAVTQLSQLINTPGQGFVPWMQQTMRFTATATSELLGFLALGTPLGEPPLVLLDGVSLVLAPEPDGVWLMVMGGLAFALMRRRGQRQSTDNA